MPERQAEVEVATPQFGSSTGSAQLGSEEWEAWMKWENIAEDNSTRGSDLSPPSLQFNSGSSGGHSPVDFDSLAPVDFSPVYSLPEPAQQTPPSKKRKSTGPGNKGSTATRQPRGQKISHNVIEKRYRSNLNDKIAKLRDSVPELRTAAPTVKKRKQTAASPGGDDSDNDDGGLKFNKATVLTKATEYIQQLERQNQRLQAELSQLRTRGGSVDKLRNPPAIATGASTVPTIAHPVKKPSIKSSQLSDSTSQPDDPAGLIKIPDDLRRFREAHATTEHYGHSFPSSLPSDDALPPLPGEPVRGMIPLADDFRRMREEGASQAHYAPESNHYGSYVSPQDTIFEDVDADENTSRWPRSKAMSRMLVGSLVGLMFMESFAESPEDPGEQNNMNARGLFSLPTALKTESRGFRAQIRQRIIAFLHSPASGRALSILLVSAIFMAVSFAIFLYLAPKGSKNVREGPLIEETSSVPPEQNSATCEDDLAVSGSSTSPNTFQPPPAYLLDSTAKVSSLRMALDLIWSEYLGLQWLRSHHLDEEAFRRGGHPTPAKDGSIKEWPDIRKSLPQFLQSSLKS